MKRLIAGQKYQLAYILTIGILYYILCHLAPITLSDDVLYKFVGLTTTSHTTDL